MVGVRIARPHRIWGKAPRKEADMDEKQMTKGREAYQMMDEACTSW